MYFLLPHWVPATWRSRAQTSMRAELPSGKVPTTRVLQRISRFSLSIFMSHSICATYCTLSTIKNRHLRNQSKMTVFCFVSEHHLDGEAAAKEIGVRPNLVWWWRGESICIFAWGTNRRSARSSPRGQQSTGLLHLSCSTPLCAMQN